MLTLFDLDAVNDRENGLETVIHLLFSPGYAHELPYEELRALLGVLKVRLSIEVKS